MAKKIFVIVLSAIVVFLMCTSIIFSGSGDDKTEAARELYTIAQDAVNGKKYDKAAELLLKAINYDPGYAEAYAKLGDVYIALKEDEVAYESYKKCLDIIAKAELVSNELAKLSDEVRRKSEKFRQIDDKIAALNNDFCAKMLQMGEQCLSDSDYFLAEELFSLLIKIDGANAVASDNLQLAREGQDNLDSSVGPDPNPELSEVYYQSGLTLLKQGKNAEAVEKLNKALSYRKEFPQALFKLGECLEKQKDKPGAIRNYRLCLKYLQKKDTFSKEEGELSNQAYKALEKIDERSRQLFKMKNDYVTAMLALANDCLARKYQRFACAMLRCIDKVDPINKKADDLLMKIDKKIIASSRQAPGSGQLVNLFNGQDLSNWRGSGAYPYDWWSVKDGKMVYAPQEKNITASFCYTGRPFDNYILAAKFYIEEVMDESDAKIVLFVGRNQAKGSYPCFVSMIGRLNRGWNYIEVIKQGNNFQGIANGVKTLSSKNLGPDDVPLVGIGIKDLKLYFTSLTMQEIKSAKTGDALPPDSANSIRLLNGKDFTGWKTATSNNADYWKIQDGKMVVQADAPAVTCWAFWQGCDVPANYDLSFDLTLNGKVSADDKPLLGLIYESDENNQYNSVNLGALLSDKGVYRISLLKENDKIQLIINGQPSAKTNISKKFILLGFQVQNLKASFYNIMLKELK